MVAPDEGNDGGDAVERGECEEGDDTLFSSTKSIDGGAAITVGSTSKGGEAFNDVMLLELPSYFGNNFGESFNGTKKRL